MTRKINDKENAPAMKEELLERITELRRENYSYKFIADHLGMSMNTVKSLCRRRGIQANGPGKTVEEQQNTKFCEYCGKLLPADRSVRLRFCSDACRAAWRRKNVLAAPKEATEERSAASGTLTTKCAPPPGKARK